MMRRVIFLQSAGAVLLLPSPAAAMTPESRSSKIAMMAVIAGMIELPPAWICEIIFAAELASEALCDPPVCRSSELYRVAAAPAKSTGLVTVNEASLAAMFSGPLDAHAVPLYQHAIDTQAAVATDELAVLETVSRRFSAQKAADAKALQLQKTTFSSLVSQTVRDKQRASAAWSAFAKYARDKKLVDKAPLDAEQGLARLKATGFSRERVAFMHRLGMTDAHITLVKSMVSTTRSVPKLRGLLPAIPTIVQLNGRNADIAACSCKP